MRVHEGVSTTAITRAGERAPGGRPARGGFAARALVVTAGHGTNDVLARLAGCTLQVPITKDRPSDAKYSLRPRSDRRPLHLGRHAGDRLPRHRDLLHPIVDGLVDAVKIGYYNPPDMPRSDDAASTASPTSSSSACPGLRGRGGHAR